MIHRSSGRQQAGVVATTLIVLLTVASTEAAPLTFAFVGDFGNASTEEAAVATRLKSYAPQFVVTLGDNNYLTGSVADMDRAIGRDYHGFIKYPASSTSAYRAQGASQVNFYPVVGNHDWDAGINNHSGYYTFPQANPRYYQFARGPVHFFMLDSDAREPDGTGATSRQALWLKSALAQSAAPWKLVLAHHPPYSSGGGTSALRWPFAAWGARALLSGHVHNYEHQFVNGMDYLVNGLGGEDIRGGATPGPNTRKLYDGDYGFMLATADDASLTFRFITRGGQVIDTVAWGRESVAPVVPGPSAPLTLLIPAAIAWSRRPRRVA